MRLRRDPGGPRRRAWSRASIVLAAALCGGQAQAQSYVRADCRAPTAPAALGADSSVTARWYRRFWTGDCSGLSGCLGGSPNWNAAVGQLVARSDAAKRPVVLKKSCRLGALIGLEWTRPRESRRIDSGDLRKFKSTLDSSKDVMSGLDAVEALARAKIARSPR